jgi:peptide/nickel transport system substrate-binding protein/oligopeptide transport system substrate-binding protein
VAGGVSRLSDHTLFEDDNKLLTQISSATAPQIFGMTGTASYPDPGNWLSIHFEPGASDNAGNVNVPLANTLMAQANTDQDAGSQEQLYNQAEQLLVTEVAWIPLDQQERPYNIAPYVQGFEFNVLDVVPLGSWEVVYLTQQG